MHRLLPRCGPNTSRWGGCVRRRHGKIRGVARYLQTLLCRRLAGTLFRRSRRELVLAADRYTQRMHRFAFAAWPRRFAHGFLCGNDGVGPSDGDAPTLLSTPQGIREPSGLAGISARRRVARLFAQISRSEPAAQENAARFRLRGVGTAEARQSRAWLAIAASAGFALARARQRRVLARCLWWVVRAAPAHGRVEESGSRGGAHRSTHARAPGTASGISRLRRRRQFRAAVHCAGIPSAVETF